MPRIDLYFKLFHNEQDILSIQSLLVSLYQNIIDFNIRSLDWYSKSKCMCLYLQYHGLCRADSSEASKTLYLLRADPRMQFQNIFKQMSDTSTEMKDRVESINLKLQMDRQQEILQKFRELKLSHQQHIEELRTVLIANNQEIVAKYEADARERQNLVQAAEVKAAEAEKRRRQEALRPYDEFSEIRAALWEVLHRSPWTKVVENSIPALDHPESIPLETSWPSWEKGQYVSRYPVDDDVGEIILIVDWKPMTNPGKPFIRWMINVPNSVYYPGRHLGRMEILKGSSALLDKTVLDVAYSRVRIFWESPIFSPLPSPDNGLLSSTGDLEESSIPLILTRALHGIAHHLIHGPFPARFPYPLPWHHMNRRIGNYFDKKNGICEDKGMRATAFFANAFTRDIEGLEDLGVIGLLSDCKKASVMAIQDLTSFYEIESSMAQHAYFEDVSRTYSVLRDQQEWVQEDRKWALRIAELAGFEHLTMAAKQWESVIEVMSPHSLILSSF